MKSSLLILPLVAALAVGTASAQKGNRKGPQNGTRAEEMATRLIKKHDTNNDSALDQAELTEALKTMHKRRMEQRGPGKGQGAGVRKGQGQGSGKGQGQGQGQGQPKRGNKPANNAE